MWISKKKYKEKLQKVYETGFDDGRKLNLWQAKIQRLTILNELEELSKNTWDQDRIETIKKLLEG